MTFMENLTGFVMSEEGLLIGASVLTGGVALVASRGVRSKAAGFIGGFTGPTNPQSAVTTRKQSKMFNGKKYKIHSVLPTKARAVALAKKLKGQKRLARVEKATETRKAASKKTWYIVYSRKK